MPTQRMQLCDLWEPQDSSGPPLPHLQSGLKEIAQVRKVKHAVWPLGHRKCALNRSSPQTTTPDTQLMGAHCVPDLGLDAKGIQQGSDRQKSLPWWGLHSRGGSSPELNEQNAACQEGQCCGQELGAVREPVVGDVEIVFTQRLEGRGSHVGLWGKSGPGRGKGQCKGLGAGMLAWPRGVTRGGSRSRALTSHRTGFSGCCWTADQGQGGLLGSC